VCFQIVAILEQEGTERDSVICPTPIGGLTERVKLETMGRIAGFNNPSSFSVTPPSLPLHEGEEKKAS
jgi:hypothetical protein